MGYTTVRLDSFYTSYNNDRPHSSIANLPPALYWRLCNIEQIKMIQHSKRRTRFKLRIYSSIPFRESISPLGFSMYTYSCLMDRQWYKFWGALFSLQFPLHNSD